MSSRCSNCGGTLIYDIQLEKVRCEHCDSTFEPEKYKVETAADEQEGNTYNTKEFTCPNCGAQISSTEFDAIDYCMYCASFVSLESQMKEVRMPDKILPFSKTKEDCKKAYKRAMIKKIYAPAEFRNESFIEGFKGVYVPFWKFNYSYGPEVILRGETTKQKGDYLVTQHYETKCKVSGEVSNSVYDASSNFDDEICPHIAPFPEDKLKDFNTSYMFGFYGDTADIDSQLYAEASDEEIKEKLWKDLSHQKSAGKGHFVSDKPKSIEKDLNLKKSSSLIMVPIWFLTWRKNDRLAYSIVNGETGKVYTEVPVDMFRFILFTLLTAIPIYFFLNAAITFSAKDMLVNAMFLSACMIIVYIVELDKQVRRYMHADDKGFLEKHQDIKKDTEDLVSKNLFSVLWEDIIGTIVEYKFYTLIIIAIAVVFFLEYVAIALCVAIIAIPLYSIYRLIKDASILDDMTVFVDVAGIAFSLIYSGILLFIDPAPDHFFYYASMLSMVGIGFAAFRMVKRYNKLITRSLPHFFEKREGDNAS